MPLLNLTRRVVAFDDLPANNNPMRRSIDWARSQLSIPVSRAGSGPAMSIPSLGEVSVFSGTRTLDVDNTTELALTLSAIAADRYRLDWTGTGTSPGFRVDRGLALSGGDLTLTLQPNSTVVVTHSLGAVFGSVQVGDTFFIAGLLTGDTALFDPLNDGEWSVLAASSSELTLVRPPGTVFSGMTETETVLTDESILAYSAAGVQAGDTLDLSSGFQDSTLRSYGIVFATSNRVDFVSAIPVATETVNPDTGLMVYNSAKRWIYIESDQEIAVKLNGSTDKTNRVTPWSAGDDAFVGTFEKAGTVYSLVIENLSTTVANVFFASAE